MRAVNRKGTYFAASGHNMKTRLRWMAFYAPSAGNLVDEGAAKHLLFRQRACFLKASWQSSDFKKAMSSASSARQP